MANEGKFKHGDVILAKNYLLGKQEHPTTTISSKRILINYTTIKGMGTQAITKSMIGQACLTLCFPRQATTMTTIWR